LKGEPAPAAPPPAAKVETKPVEKPAAPPPLDLTEKVVAPPPPSEPAQAPITIEMMDSPMTDNDKASSLMSPETATAVTDSLSKLLASNVAVEEDIGRPGKVTLEQMARDLMKPLIKTWLDQNLPGIIEKAVQKEVEKLARRAMDR
jgi:cell pole-organizing protein PopZ